MIDLNQKLQYPIRYNTSKSILYSKYHMEYWLENSRWQYWLNTLIRKMNVQHKCKKSKQLIFSSKVLYNDISRITIEAHSQYTLIYARCKYLSSLCEFIARCNGQILTRRFRKWYLE